MKRLLLLTIIITSSLLKSNAGGLVTNTNRSASFLRQMAIGTTLNSELVQYNPAGAVFINSKYSFGLNNQVAIQRRIIESSFEPFSSYTTSGQKTPTLQSSTKGYGEKRYTGETLSPIVPSLYAIYKPLSKVAFMASISIVGGGGTVKFHDGLPSFETIIAQLPTILSMQGLPTDKYSTDIYLKATSFVTNGRIGAAYRINEWLSAAAMLDINYYYANYKGHIGNTMVNSKHHLLNPAEGNMVDASDLFFKMGNTNYANMLSYKELICRQTGVAISPAIALYAEKDGWQMSLRYDLKNSLTTTNHTKKDIELNGTSLYPDGAKTDAQMPALAAATISKRIKGIKLSGEYHQYFDKKARNNYSNAVTRNSTEYIFGVEYNVLPCLLISGAFQKTNYNLDKDKLQDMNYIPSSFSMGLGLRYEATGLIAIDFGIMNTLFETVTKEQAIYNNNSLGLSGKDTFTKKSTCIGVGIEFKF